ncbi:cytochrome c oxidase subunit VB [Eremomyces bilateralis CBS 781.70]|uniref:Cytochrome c oxidase subunit 4, mitochondrial n=1 Tax=Eremomyces bilateralis CBS 781.70 TaxID=1392243 RepID=A0A6G1GE47_9PEZI|nr:cytochrome c oxidase subunit VB [Eremomyces bilateralis CBS 781.70]KAF1816176.1 cytochrome c oxidase subunit VB [Eremomyces bilateralis CBS 781.70]
MAARSTKAVAVVSGRQFSQVAARCDAEAGKPAKTYKKFEEIRSEHDLYGPGVEAGKFPTDIEQSTGLERLEVLGKMEGVDIFDMTPLDASRLGTMEDPITVNSFGDEQYAGCTGFPVDSHGVKWLVISRERPIERCPECGSVYKMNYLGPTEDEHAHHDEHGHDDHHHAVAEDPKTFADFVKPDYRWT